MFALLMEPYTMIQVSILLQPHRTVIANFVPGNFGLILRNPWKPLAEPWGSVEPRLKNTVLKQYKILFNNFRVPLDELVNAFIF